MNRYLKQINNILVNQDERSKFQLRILLGIFAVVAFGMTILNIFTQIYSLAIVTAIFSALCVINMYLSYKGENYLKIASIMFMIEIGALMLYFIITGGTENFSIQWLIILPALGVIFFGLKNGTILSAVMFVLMLLFFWVPPFCNITTNYGSTFRLRFPIVYVCSFVLALIIEYIRMLSEREIVKERKRYRYLYCHDALTGLANRYYLENELEKIKETDKMVAEAMFDIDHFKSINDQYGHKEGDVVLKDLADICKSVLPEGARPFRWGGEEFVVLFEDASVAEESMYKLLDAVRSHDFVLGGETIKVTISIGVCYSDVPASQTDFEKLIIKADDKMYEIKNSGRNNVGFAHL